MSNTGTDEVVAFVRRIENILDDMESKKSEYMSACKELREDITEIYAEAKAAGTSKKALKAVVKTRALERKLDAVRDRLDDDDQAIFDQYRERLGDLADTPLGRAALQSASTESEIKSQKGNGLTEGGDVPGSYEIN